MWMGAYVGGNVNIKCREGGVILRRAAVKRSDVDVCMLGPLTVCNPDPPSNAPSTFP